MLFNQVVFIIDDLEGSGLQLTERFLLEDSKVILCTNDVLHPLSRWQDEVVEGKLIVIDLMAYPYPQDYEELFKHTIDAVSHIDSLVYCCTIDAAAKPKWTEQAVHSHELLKQVLLKVEHTRSTSSLLLMGFKASGHSLRSVQEPIDELPRAVTRDADELMHAGIRHNLLIHEYQEQYSNSASFTNAAVFLCSDWGQNIYGQVMHVREVPAKTALLK